MAMTTRISLIATFCMLVVLPAFAVEKLGPRAAHEAMSTGGLILVDIRRPDEWHATGSAKGALRINMLSSDFMARIKELQASNPNRKIALICQVGVRSARLSEVLEDQGLKDLVDVVGGTQLWIDQGLPISH
jgi:rhodanese-related sulfurtransferase